MTDFSPTVLAGFIAVAAALNAAFLFVIGRRPRI
jgi:hypothetical protein